VIRALEAAEFPKGLHLDLTDPLSRQAELAGYFFQGVFSLISDSEPHPNDFLLRGRKHAQYALGPLCYITMHQRINLCTQTLPAFLRY